MNPTTTERRSQAAAHAHNARRELREAAKLLDGLGETGHQNALHAIVATDDLMDAVVHAEAVDRSLEDLERIS